MSKTIKTCFLLGLTCINILFCQYEDKFKELDLEFEEKPGLAILELDNNGVTKSEALALTDRLRLELFRHNKYNIMERQKMNEILNEMKFQLADCTSDECAVEIGRLIGVQKMVAGSVSKVGEYYTVSARIIDIETGVLEKTAVEDIDGTLGMVLTKAIPSISRQLCGIDVTDYKVKQFTKVEEKKAFIKIYTAPSEAMVYLDNNLKGITPIKLEVEPGMSFNIKISKKNYENYQRNYQIAAGTTRDITVVLDKSVYSQLPPQKQKQDEFYKPNKKNKVFEKAFRLSFVSMEEVDDINNFINKINTKVSINNYQIFNKVFNLTFTNKMKSFNGFSLTTGQGLTSFLYLDFNLGMIFSSFENNSHKKYWSYNKIKMNILLPNASLDIKITPLGRRFISPYAKVGFGYNMFILKAKHRNSEIASVNYHSWGLSYGAGLELRLGNVFGIGAEWMKQNMEMKLTSIGKDSDKFEDAGLEEFNIKEDIFKIILNFYHK